MQADHQPVHDLLGKGSLPKREARRAARAAQLSRLWAISEQPADRFAILAERLSELVADPTASIAEQV